jgi:hypothetical protein
MQAEVIHKHCILNKAFFQCAGVELLSASLLHDYEKAAR